MKTVDLSKKIARMERKYSETKCLFCGSSTLIVTYQDKAYWECSNVLCTAIHETKNTKALSSLIIAVNPNKIKITS